jgi:histone H3/H4
MREERQPNHVILQMAQQKTASRKIVQLQQDIEMYLLEVSRHQSDMAKHSGKSFIQVKFVKILKDLTAHLFIQ